MDTKKWPVLAQVLIGLGIISGIINVIAGLYQRSIVTVIGGIIGLVIYWNFYKYKKWALLGVNVMLSLGVVATLLAMRSIHSWILYVAVVYLILVLIYFNSERIKGLFNRTQESEGEDSLA